MVADHGSIPSPGAMKTKQTLLDERVTYSYYLGYSHYMYGLHLWRERSAKGDDTLPKDMLEEAYRHGYDQARQDVASSFEE